MAKYSRYILIVILIANCNQLLAQTTCTEQLRTAQRRYETGVLDEIPRILESCLERGFTREEKVSAYRLLIQTYIFTDRMDEADQVMLNFLRDFPEYSILSADYREFINLYNTYHTDPIMRIEASLGGIASLPTITEYYGPEDLNGNTPSYSTTAGFNLEANYLKGFTPTIDGSFGVSLSLLTLGYTNNPYLHSTVNATYSNLYIGMPLAARYKLMLLGVNAFVKGGIEPSYMLSSSINFSRARTGGQDPITGSVNMIPYSKRLDIRPIIGFGVDFRLGSADLMVTAGFKMGTIKPTNPKYRYSNEDIFQRYYFIADDYLLHQAFISISYIFSVYNPKKL